MSASLVGSEMCIRDRCSGPRRSGLGEDYFALLARSACSLQPHDVMSRPRFGTGNYSNMLATRHMVHSQ
eukprot:6701858-Alexandrium_andersonii.AAC.1